MRAVKYSAHEIALAKELSGFDNKWAALVKVGSREKVVASGERITDAKAAADRAGFKNPTFRKVPSRGKVLIAGLF